MNSILNLEDYECCLNILSLSYKYLPEHLKPCFLYMGIFLENQEIRVLQLIKLWIAEGLVEPDRNSKSLEEIGQDYLKDLIDWNLVLVQKSGAIGNFKTCYLHDCIRDLCLRIAREEKFVYASRNHYIPQDILNEHRVILLGNHLSQEFDILYPLRCRTLICSGGNLPQLEDKSLHVLDAVHINSFEDIFQHADLRYIGCHTTSVCRVPSTISNLLSLQTIICCNSSMVSAPMEIWNMKHLRHVEFSEISLPDPPSSTAKPDEQILPCLHTFMRIVNFSCSAEVLWRMQRVKKLKIKYDGTEGDYCIANLHHFSMLESLKICFCLDTSKNLRLLRRLSFPISLRQLSLDNLKLRRADMNIVASLPNLEDLKLKGITSGSWWGRFRMGFCCLKSLKIVSGDEVGGVSHLLTIPLEIGDIPGLRVFEIRNIGAVTAISAAKMLVDRENYGIEGLQVKVSFMNKQEMLQFKRLQELSNWSISTNFTVEAGPEMRVRSDFWHT
ncbi:toMV resistant protein Tm-2 netted virescent-like [Andrographis paniculata]|uniref:toMV resistant protein Tm-2 netted virescent-like n=1 Tax=Andrographis paniculata TaxID=175694 RepID=UPI0021E7493B|nr:toMV resistant protein Tm-2 netted virescent-like [Andrographis paniculata]